MTSRLADADELLHTCASPLLCCCLPRPPPVWSCTSSLRVIPPTLHTRRIQVPALACVEPSGGVPAVPHLPRAGRVQPLPLPAAACSGGAAVGPRGALPQPVAPAPALAPPAACRGQRQPRARPNVLENSATPYPLGE